MCGPLSGPRIRRASVAAAPSFTGEGSSSLSASAIGCERPSASASVLWCPAPASSPVPGRLLSSTSARAHWCLTPAPHVAGHPLPTWQ